MRRYLIVMLVFSLAILTGCADKSASQVIRFGLQSEPISLDPRMATDATSERINRLIYRALVSFDKQFRPVPELADWRQLSALHYRFTLLNSSERGFHDGGHLTANDVASCYRFILDKANASPHRGNLSHIKTITVIDDDTVDFELSHPDILFPGRLTIGIPASANTNTGFRPVGTGPFKVTNAQHMHALKLTRVHDGQLFHFMHVPNTTVRILKLLRGEIDLLQNEIAGYVDYLSNQQGINVDSHPGTTFSYLGFNMDDAMVGQLKLRKAIAYAIDRQSLIDHLLGRSAVISHSLLPPQHWASQAQLSGFAHQPDKARALLNELGYDIQNRPHIIYKTTTDNLRLRIATVIQQQLAEVGIDMSIQSHDWGTFYADIKAGNFQMYGLSWVGVRSPDIYQYVFHSQSLPPAGANRGRYRNKQVDDWIDSMLAAQTLDEIPDSLDKVRRTLLDELPYIPMWFENHVYAANASIKNYHLSQDGNYDALTGVTKQRIPTSRVSGL